MIVFPDFKPRLYVHAQVNTSRPAMRTASISLTSAMAAVDSAGVWIAMETRSPGHAGWVWPNAVGTHLKALIILNLCRQCYLKQIQGKVLENHIKTSHRSLTLPTPRGRCPPEAISQRRIRTWVTKETQSLDKATHRKPVPTQTAKCIN